MTSAQVGARRGASTASAAVRGAAGRLLRSAVLPLSSGPTQAGTTLAGVSFLVTIGSDDRAEMDVAL
jgi:hypothetical protein